MAERTRVIKRQISFLLKRNFEFENENRSKLDKTKTGLALSVNLLLNNCPNPTLPKNLTREFDKFRLLLQFAIIRGRIFISGIA